MKKFLVKDQQRRQEVQHQELQRRALKACLRETSLPWPQRWAAMERLAALSRNGTRTRIRNRCVLSGRGRGTLRSLKMSRIRCREWISKGALLGATQASW